MYWPNTCEQGEKVVSALRQWSVPPMIYPVRQVIRKSLGKIYQHYLLGRMKKFMARKLPQLQDTLALNEQQLRTHDSWDFDNQVTAPLHGFTMLRLYQRAVPSPI